MPIEYGPETVWPPVAESEAAGYYREWLAWYRGTPGGLQNFYSGRYAAEMPRTRPSQLRGGVSGALGRFFWGKPLASAQSTTRLHIPAASDISMISADMLFGEPPALTVPDGEQAQEALETILDESGAYSALHEAAEQDSAIGGVYLRARVNVDVADVPIIDSILPDNAVPEWWGPYLQAVTFWRVLSEADRTPVLRHIERHEVINGIGLVFHALYVGAPDRLGRRVPLTDHPETARLAELVDSGGAIPTGATRLDVEYVPNIRPHRLIRGTPLGRSDYQGAEPIMDALDETWSSWMRDLRLAKARMVVPREYLRSAGARGEGSFFDAEQEIFQSVAAQQPAGATNLLITPIQFAIRVEEHERTAIAQTRLILQAAGLDGSDAQSENQPAETATKVNKDTSRKRATRAKKQGYWTPALRRLGFVLLELNAAHYGGPAAAPVSVEWPDIATPDGETLARTLQLLDAAGAASTRTKVEMLHPDWPTEDIDREVIDIDGAAMEDPGAFTGAPGGPVDNSGDNSGDEKLVT